jgi:serpin B
MYSDEYKYLDDGKATGFIKPYAGNKYSFAALLPNENIQIDEYIQSLTGTGFLNMIKNAENIIVQTYLPKFKYEYEIKMNDALKTLGMPDAFHDGKADFKKMATSSDGNIYIGEVLHKTFISVDELGTKAGAVTKVEIQAECVIEYEKTVRLDRPFVYAIIDNATNLPVFIGTVVNFK